MVNEFLQYLSFLKSEREHLKTVEDREQYMLIERITKAYIKHTNQKLIIKPSKDRGYSDLL